MPLFTAIGKLIWFFLKNLIRVLITFSPMFAVEYIDKTCYKHPSLHWHSSNPITITINVITIIIEFGAIIYLGYIFMYKPAVRSIKEATEGLPSLIKEKTTFLINQFK